MTSGAVQYASVIVATLLAACSEATMPRAPANMVGRIVFSRAVYLPVEYRYQQDLYSMKPDGSHVRLLLHEPGHVLVTPVVSPDGSQIAVVAYYDTAGVSASALFVVDADGKNLHRIPVPNFLEGATWAPDGNRLATVGFQNYQPILFVATADGQTIAPLMPYSGDRFSPAWSPDGATIAFASDSGRDSVGAYSLFVMDSNGTNTRLLAHQRYTDQVPIWSRGGGSLSYLSGRSAFPNAAFLIRPDGSGETQITFPPDSATCSVVSPDGQEVLICLNDQIWSVRADGTSRRQLTHGSAISGSPSWGPPASP